MELKSIEAVKRSLKFGSSNRTFMELKYLSRKYDNSQIHCSNRTFMELKLLASLQWKYGTTTF